MREEKLEARAATRRSMDQITGALLGIALVLSAVLVPMAFFGGSAGVIYRQFSITLVSAMALSVVVALTLTPALCASMLRSADLDHSASRGPLAWFERGYNRLSLRYQAIVSRLLPLTNRAMVLYLGVVALMALLYVRLPTSFLPDEDQGVVMAIATLPPGALLDRTIAAQRQVEGALLGDKKTVTTVLSVAGRSWSGNGQNTGMSFAMLKDWSDRPGEDLTAAALLRRVSAKTAGIRDANIFPMSPPLIRGLGNTGGFDLQLEDVGGVGRATLTRARDQFLELAGRDPLLSHVRINGLAEQPEFHLEVDQAKAGALGLSTASINDTLTNAIGGYYVNDFVDRGRVKKVYIQADAPFRMQPADLGNWFVRNGAGGMVPVSAFASGSWSVSAQSLERFNGAASVEIVGDPAPGVASGTALRRVEQLIKQLPAGIGYEWAGLSYQEKLSGARAPALYAISVLFVFLCLAALYESWSLPFSVMLVVPLGVIGSLAAASLRGLANDIYFQVGLLTTVGLAAKNAILIVEFARTLYEGGTELTEAVRQAVRIRLRPILMTSMSFMLGVMPLVLAHGAGASGRIAIGTGVFGGMLAATVLGVFFVPLFVIFVQRLLGRGRPPAGEANATEAFGR
jgi:multidrug efflux pump